MLAIPLGVRLSNAKATAHVTRDLQDVRFRASIPWGYEYAELELARGFDPTTPELAIFTDCLIYDRRNDETVWQGELADPGSSGSASGQIRTIRALGGGAMATDTTFPYYVIDRSLERFAQRPQSMDPSGEAEVTDTAAGADAVAPQLLMQARRGIVANTNWLAGREHRGTREAGQTIARISGTYASPSNRTNWQASIVVRGGAVAQETLAIALPAGQAAFSRVITTNFTAGHNIIELRLVYKGVAADTVPTDNLYVRWFGIVLRAVLKGFDAAGLPVDLTTAANYANDYVLSHEVVRDLLARSLTGFDGANASIATGTTQIQQLAYPDLTTPAKVFEDLATFEVNSYPAVWERRPNGKWRFEWTRWATTPRYYMTLREGLLNGAAANTDLYDSVVVRWRDANGLTRYVIRTQVIPEFGTRHRQGSLDMSDETGSLLDAQVAGDAFLSAHRYAANMGSVTVTQPVFDALTGRMVMPWEVKPGHLLAIRGVTPNPDSLNPAGQYGVTVFRIQATETSGASGQTTFTLDNSPLLTSEQLADLSRRFERRRRR